MKKKSVVYSAQHAEQAALLFVLLWLDKIGFALQNGGHLPS